MSIIVGVQFAFLFSFNILIMEVFHDLLLLAKTRALLVGTWRTPYRRSPALVPSPGTPTPSVEDRAAQIPSEHFPRNTGLGKEYVRGCVCMSDLGIIVLCCDTPTHPGGSRDTMVFEYIDLFHLKSHCVISPSVESLLVSHLESSDVTLFPLLVAALFIPSSVLGFL